MKQSRIYITPHRETGNLANGTKNGADMLDEPMWMKQLRCMHSVTVRSLCLSVILVLEFSDRGIFQIGSRPNISIRKSS